MPKYSNPDGIIYSEETIRRFANLKPAAPDFTIMWDNAYNVHQFRGEYVPFPDILSLCEKAGKPDMVFEFASTSKITFAGGGISCVAASQANIAYLSKLFGIQMISQDKINQLRHVRFLRDKAHTLELMKKHAAHMAILAGLPEKARSAIPRPTSTPTRAKPFLLLRKSKEVPFYI